MRMDAVVVDADRRVGDATHGVVISAKGERISKKYITYLVQMDAEAGERGWIGTVVVMSAVDKRINKSSTYWMDGRMRMASERRCWWRRIWMGTVVVISAVDER